MTVVWVVLGAALGAPLRYVAGHLLDDAALPWGTVLVNVAGSFLLGLFSAMALADSATAFLGVGFCGALTTFSALTVQTLDRGPVRGTANLLLTIPPALLACALGFVLGG
ncbi:MAG: fluoride exporter [Nocardioidaceae bacterium]|nr:fluoride exporter [Nocardioidaceae bacterium]